MSYQKLNLNSSNELFRPLGDVVDWVVLSGCDIPIEIGMRLSHWVFQVHLLTNTQIDEEDFAAGLTSRPWSRFWMEVVKVVFSPLL